MKDISVAGFSQIFPSWDITYDTLVRRIPSEVIIETAIVLNSELYVPVEMEQTQRNLLRLISKTFSKEQIDQLNVGYSNLSKATQMDFWYVFGKRYLLEFILKELNAYRTVENYVYKTGDEYFIFLAYLKVIDEVHRIDNFALPNKHEKYWKYKILWSPAIIRQFHFAETPNILFEIFKLFVLLHYMKDNWRQYLKEYLNKLGFDTNGQLLKSLQTIFEVAAHYDEKAVLKKHAYLNPTGASSHPDSQEINQLVGFQKVIEAEDLRKFPLYKCKKGFKVIDRDIYQKKMYNGPYFEIFYNTSFSQTFKFNAYSSKISKELIENKLFRLILRKLTKEIDGFLYFDCEDDGEGLPDGYFRVDNKLFLFELKAYYFPDKLIKSTDFDEIKSYIDERFIMSSGGKYKGIGQISEQIKKIANHQFAFDSRLNDFVNDNSLIIYPIICHNDFNFTLFGINEYLQDSFIPLVSQNELNIRPLTVIGLEVLYDLMMRFNGFPEIEILIENYNNMLKEAKEIFQSHPTSSNFRRASKSIDTFYNESTVKNEHIELRDMWEILKELEIDLETTNAKI